MQPTDRSPRRIRATVEEYELADVTVTMLVDPDNERAWLQSDHTVSVVR